MISWSCEVKIGYYKAYLQTLEIELVTKTTTAKGENVVHTYFHLWSWNNHNLLESVVDFHVIIIVINYLGFLSSSHNYNHKHDYHILWCIWSTFVEVAHGSIIKLFSWWFSPALNIISESFESSRQQIGTALVFMPQQFADLCIRGFFVGN